MSTHRTHRRQYEELYADDEFVSPSMYGRLMEEADELDRRDEANAEALSRWELLAEAETEEEA